MSLINELEDLGLETGQWLPEGGLSEPFTEAHYAFRTDGKQLELLAVEASASPTDGRVRELWQARQQKQAKGLLLLVEVGSEPDQLIACGPAEVDLTVHRLPRSQMMALLKEALAEDTPQAAERFLAERLKVADEEPIPGLLNSALFADHTLVERARSHPDWSGASEDAESIEGCEGSDLVEALGFTVTEGPGGDAEGLKVLRESGGKARALGLFLDRDEEFDQRSGRFTDRSPTVVAIERARQENLPFVLITRGSKIRLHPTGERVGVGRKDAVETFIEAHVPELSREDRAFVPLLFSARALVDGGTFEEVLSWSRDYSADLSARLRERVYNEVVPGLAMAIAAQTSAGDLAEADLDLIYEQAMLVLFRLLFIAYAEDRDLLPYRLNDAYHENSLKSVAKELASRGAEGPTFEGDTATDLWARVGSLWEAVDKGNQGWGVPPYGGGLFDADASVAATGLVGMVLDNEVFGPPLTSLLVERAEGEAGPVDFRSLAVRDFGTIYEGLLESSISVAPSDLKLDRKGNYVPASEDDEPDAVVVEAGTVYHHNRSGQRKATGSYFTKEFAVEHLLDKALEPALDAHLERVEALIESEGDEAASKAFFDFRCADIAMGSGHFLVAASDRIEDRFTQFLLEHPLEGVQKELAILRASATDSLGPSAGEYEIDDRMLLRRLVARRCLYGVDLNQIAVELARLAIWVHTFVPGLPLSFLDHTLVYGDSLTGIGTVEEAQEYLTEQETEAGGTRSFFSDQILEWLEEASAPLLRLANAVDSTREDLEQAKKDQAEALEKVEPVRDLFDLICAHRRGDLDLLFQAGLSNEVVAGHPALENSREKGKQLRALHFPVVFPEVFLGRKRGFNCILGNPPWDKVRHEPRQFWVVVDPGLQAIKGAENQRKRIEELRALHPEGARTERLLIERSEQLQNIFRSQYSWQGTGHLEYSKLFTERALDVINENGELGYVLPRAMLVLGGWTKLRERLLSESSLEVFQARNAGGWLFDDVEFRYMIVFTIRHQNGRGDAWLWPAAKGPADLVGADERTGVRLDALEIDRLTDRKALPWLESLADVATFQKLASFGRVGEESGWVTAKADTRWDFSGSGRHKALVMSEESSGSWKVLKARHVLPYGIDYEKGFDRFVSDPCQLVPLGRDIEAVEGSEELGDSHPRLIYRFPTMQDNTRSLIAAWLPSVGVLYSTGYVHGIDVINGSDRAAKALLGLFNSFVCDWWVRRFVDRHITAPIITGLPLPNWDEGDIAYVSDRVDRLLADSLDEEQWNSTYAEIEQAVVAGFGLSRSEVEGVLEDFSEKALAFGARDEFIRVVSKAGQNG